MVKNLMFYVAHELILPSNKNINFFSSFNFGIRKISGPATKALNPQA